MDDCIVKISLITKYENLFVDFSHMSSSKDFENARFEIGPNSVKKGDTIMREGAQETLFDVSKQPDMSIKIS